MRTKAMLARVLVSTALLLSPAVTLSGCGGAGRDTNAGGEPAPMPQTPAGPGGISESATASRSDDNDDDGCPVSGSTLLKAFEMSGFSEDVKTDAMTNVVCYKGWATAGQKVAAEFEGRVQPVTVLFKYEQKSKVWTYVVAGTSQICPKDLPKDIHDHFEICVR
jgi:hypothetical protein